MKPIEVSTRTDRPREEVYDFLDVLANHEPYTDHMLVDWSYDGPAAGVGARARMRANLPGPKDWIDMEVKQAERPVRSVEESVGADGARRTRGTYVLEEEPGGGTLIRFTLEFLQVPARERILAPFTRAWLRRGNVKAMERLHTRLAQPGPLPTAERAAAA